MPFYQPQAICTSCGIRLSEIYWHNGNPYCQMDYEVQIDYDNADIIEEAYQEFHNLMQLFKSE